MCLYIYYIIYVPVCIPRGCCSRTTTATFYNTAQLCRRDGRAGDITDFVRAAVASWPRSTLYLSRCGTHNRWPRSERVSSEQLSAATAAHTHKNVIYFFTVEITSSLSVYGRLVQCTRVKRIQRCVYETWCTGNVRIQVPYYTLLSVPAAAAEAMMCVFFPKLTTTRLKSKAVQWSFWIWPVASERRGRDNIRRVVQ